MQGLVGIFSSLLLARKATLQALKEEPDAHHNFYILETAIDMYLDVNDNRGLRHSEFSHDDIKHLEELLGEKVETSININYC